MTTDHRYKQYKAYILGLESPLYELAKKETDLRLKYLIFVTNHAVHCLRRVILDTNNNNYNDLDIDRYKYRIPNRIYLEFLKKSREIIKKKCERGINFNRFKKVINNKTIWNTIKGYWFHNVPSVITEYLWIPSLKDIYKFYNNIANNWSSIINNGNFSALQIQEYLHKNFLKNLLELNCQINQHSNPSGSIIQCACWKHDAFQRIINQYFVHNHSNYYTFNQWINKKQNGYNTNLSINQIVSKFIRVHAQIQYANFIKTINIKNNNNDHQQHINLNQIGKNRVESMTKNDMFHSNDDVNNDTASFVSGKTSFTSFDSTQIIGNNNNNIPPLPPLLPLIFNDYNNKNKNNNINVDQNNYNNSNNMNMRQFQNEYNFDNMHNPNKQRLHWMQYEERRENDKLKRKQLLEQHRESIQRRIGNNNQSHNLYNNYNTYNQYNSYNPSSNSCPKCCCQCNNNLYL